MGGGCSGVHARGDTLRRPTRVPGLTVRAAARAFQFVRRRTTTPLLLVVVVDRLFCSRLEDNEVLCIKGAERYSLHSGYGHTFKWKADHRDATPRFRPLHPPLHARPFPARLMDERAIAGMTKGGGGARWW